MFREYRLVNDSPEKNKNNFKLTLMPTQDFMQVYKSNCPNGVYLLSFYRDNAEIIVLWDNQVFFSGFLQLKQP